MITHTPSLVLASQSEGRKTLLTKLGIAFDVLVSTVDEDAIVGKTPLQTLALRAGAKAEAVVSYKLLVVSEKKKSYNNKPTTYNLPARNASHNHAGGQPTTFLVIAADSGVILDDRLYGKPQNNNEIRETLGLLMGRTHTFATHTSIRLLNNSRVTKSWEDTVTSRVSLRRLTSEELDSYIKIYNLTKFAGGYAVDGAPWDIVTKIEGSYTNVIGLPLEIILPIFREFNIIL